MFQKWIHQSLTHKFTRLLNSSQRLKEESLPMRITLTLLHLPLLLFQESLKVCFLLGVWGTWPERQTLLEMMTLQMVVLVMVNQNLIKEESCKGNLYSPGNTSAGMPASEGILPCTRHPRAWLRDSNPTAYPQSSHWDYGEGGPEVSIYNKH